MKLITALICLFSNFVIAQEKPNIVLILADDLGSGDVSSYNDQSKINTPNIDQLVTDGIKFTDGHSNSAVCTPTRYGVLTGRYAWRTRLKKGVLRGYSPALIASDRSTIASELKQAGYTTACIGKWHLGMGIAKANNKNTWDYTKPIQDGPTTRGFDYFLGISASLDMPPYALIENDTFIQPLDSHQESVSEQLHYLREGDISSQFKHEAYLPLLAKQASDWIKTSAEKENPFFLYMPLPSPHKPVVPSEQFRGKSGIGEYGDYVLATDWAVGEIINALKKSGEYDNTVIIFTSDNGSFAVPTIYKVGGGHSVNGIYRGQKTDIYEGGHRVPFIISWPNQNGYAHNKGKSSNLVISTIDLFATLKNVISPKSTTHADGVSFHNYLKGDMLQTTPVVKASIFHSVTGTFAIRSGKWKLILSKGSGGRSAGKVSTAGQLYDMDNDPSEEHNLYTENPEQIAKLTKLLNEIKAKKF